MRAGEVLFVPRGWWHAVLNIEDDTIAVTQNYVCRRNLLQVTRFIREKPEQVGAVILFNGRFSGLTRRSYR